MTESTCAALFMGSLQPGGRIIADGLRGRPYPVLPCFAIVRAHRVEGLSMACQRRAAILLLPAFLLLPIRHWFFLFLLLFLLR